MSENKTTTTVVYRLMFQHPAWTFGNCWIDSKVEGDSAEGLTADDFINSFLEVEVFDINGIIVETSLASDFKVVKIVTKKTYTEI